MESDCITRPGIDTDAAHAELLRRILGPRGAARRAGRLLREAPLATLSRLPAGTLQALASLTEQQARRLAACFALGRAVEQARPAPERSLRHPADVARLMGPVLRGLEREAFHVLLLDSKHRLRARREVSVGTLTTSIVHPREVFRDAVRFSAAAVVAVHNHPSGDPEPSAEDREVTRRLIECGELLGIPLLDHVVIGDGRWVSLRERLAF